MPHVNHRRGETARFVYRREHGKITHRTCYKGKNQSDKDWKVLAHRLHRRQDRMLVTACPEDPFPRRRRFWSLAWVLW